MRRPWVLLTLLALANQVPAQNIDPRYRQVVVELQRRVERQMADKHIPALAIALVDDQRVVWSQGFGFQDRAKTKPATANTVYRVGSVSKLFTDVAVMQLVEQGKLSLDEPVAKYLPTFQPTYQPGDKPITLRMLMAHRSGLVREPPVGNYFDASEPSLEKSVESLNGIDLVYRPGEKTKYSNAAVGIVGLVLQEATKQPFATEVQTRVLDPLGMAASSFTLTPAVKANLADAVMATNFGREFPAPGFQLGVAPAGCMYSTAPDLAKFISCLFADGQANGKRLLSPASLKQMLTPQFPGKDAKHEFGLGFMITDLDGRVCIGHGGAIYGFATELNALPKEKLGVVVIASLDGANGVTNHLADEAVRMMLAAKEGRPLPKADDPLPFTAAEARSYVGRYRAGERWFDLEEHDGKLCLLQDRGVARVAVKKQGTLGNLVVDDRLAIGTKLERKGEALVFDGLEYFRQEDSRTPPPAPPERWRGLIGEYGPDHNKLFILEREGKLFALIEWVEYDELTEESPDVFAFPKDRGMYFGEKLVFTRDASGRATKVVAANVPFERRTIPGENGETFRLKPVKPIAELRKAALAAKPPLEKNPLHQSDLIDLAEIDPGFRFDIRYATDNNFLSAPFYTLAKAYFQRPAAVALKRVQAKLAPLGYGLLIHDSYRPWHVTKMFWDATPDHLHNFVADPSKGSRHNRGCAVDLTLYDLKTGKPIEMVGGYDEMTDRSYPAYPGGTSRQRWHRDLLRQMMESEGFTVYPEEWWHFDYHDWPSYPIQNLTFEELAKK